MTACGADGHGGTARRGGGEHRVDTRRRRAALAVLTLVVGLTAVIGVSGGGASVDTRGRTSVVASFFPLAEAASQVGGRHVVVRNLTPPGVEPHDLELSTRSVDEIDGADLAIVMGDDFQPAIEDAAERRDGATLVVLDALAGHVRADDPHVWLDPTRMIGVVDAVAARLARVDTRHARLYRKRAERYTAELRTLDSDYRAGLAHCARRLVVTGHDAFGYLADAYHLDERAVSGLSPDAEPDARRLGELADLARTKSVTTVFSEALVSPKVARTVAREAGGLRVEVLNPLEGLSEREQRAGADYVSVMRDNLRALRTALDCS
jgi:zinc transport system substrate-binding protein